MRALYRELRRTLPPVYWTVWLGTLVNRAGAFVGPILTFYLTEQLGLSLGEAGAIVAAWGAGSFVASLIGGVLADHIGRRATMLASLLGGSVAMLALSLTREPLAIAAASLGLGFVGDLYRPAVSAFIADVIEPQHRLRAYGALYWAINLGFSIAPVLGGLIATHSYRALFWGDAATTAIFALVVLARVPETHPDPTRSLPSTTTLATIARDRLFMRFWIFAALQGLVVFQMMTTLTGWMAQQGHGPRAYGAVLAINGGLIVVFQPALTEWTARFDRRNVLATSALLMGAGFALHGVSSLLAVHAIAVAVWTVGEIINSPAASAFVADRAPPEARGRYQGVYAMSWGLASCLAPIVGPRVLAFSPLAMWGGCLVVGAIAAIGYRSMPRNNPTTSANRSG
ncbi:MAG TPA: MFS transporter [Kofleriaceae bacterium]|nr:MFS transporter [Kofleriaceae bacterium]